MLNNFFADQTLLSGQDDDLPSNFPLTKDNISMISVNATTVKELLSILDPSKAYGHDGISPKILKNTAKSISLPLSKIFNYSLRTASYPETWKLAFVTPLFKKGDQKLTKNYRPISLLCTISKVFERIVFKEVFNFILDRKKLTKYQAAYTPGSSTESQLLEIYSNITMAMDEKEIIRYVFCDCSKAFDRVWHKGLLHKMEAMGIRGTLLKWFKSYLSNRCQQVVVNGTKSATRDLQAGVPQGSILGPLLFIIYTNDIVDQVQSNIRLYADDSSIYCKGKDIDQINKTLNEDLDTISKWAKKWKILFNPQKTVSITFTNKHLNNVPNLKMDNTEILEEKSHKHLGCIFQDSGKWRLHIEELTTKCAKKIDVLRSLRFQLDRNALEQLYKSFIRPSMEYASSVWTNCSIEQKTEIEKLQLHASRIITGAIKGTRHSALYNECDLITTHERRRRKNLITYYKVHHRLCPSYLQDIKPPLVNETTHYNLRNKNDVKTINTRTSLYQNSFIPATSKIWNSLPDDTKYIGGLNEFKKDLTKDDKKTPKYHHKGKRRYQILMARLRMKCSKLNSHLFEMKIINDPTCSCGHEVEDEYHYFFHCPQYNEQRRNLLQLDNIHHRNTNILLNGCKGASENTNSLLFETVVDYIEKSERF